MTKPSPATQISFIPRFIKAALVSTCCFSISNIAFAGDGQYSAAFPYTPGFTLMGLTGSNTTGYADAMLPALGTPTSFLYVDPQIIFGSNSYTASLGTGFRYLNDTAGILGAYLFADYNHSSNSNNFWFLSPGVERLGETVDFSANVYIPVSSQSQNVSSTMVTGQQLGTNDFISFQQHSEFDQLFTTLNVESVGAGADAEIGFRIPLYNNPKLYLGGYYFAPQDAEDITGATARIEMPITNRFTFLLSDGYDNVEGNTFKLGLSYNFGGRKNSKFFTDKAFANSRLSSNLTERMVDPVHRNLVAISGGSDTAQPIIQTQTPPTASTVLLEDQIAFFDVTAPVDGDGTYEHPFNLFDQTNVDAANTGGNTNLFVNTGTYNIGNNTITLTNDNLYGRQDYNGNPFFQPATGNNRPLFSFSLPTLPIGKVGFSLVDNNTFDSVSISNTIASGGVGISINNPANQTETFSINNSTVNNFLIGLNVFGNNIGSSLVIDMTSSNFDSNSIGFNLSSTPSFGGNNLGTATINASNTTFDNNNTVGFGIGNEGTININATNTSFTGNLNGGGLLLSNNSGSTATINLTNSNLNNNTVNAAAGALVLINNSSTLVANIVDSNFNNNTLGSGLYLNDQILDMTTGSSVLNITNSNFNGNTLAGLNLNSFDSQNMTVNLNSSSAIGNFGAAYAGAYLSVDANVDTPTNTTLNATDSIFQNNAGHGVFGQNAFSAPATMFPTVNITLTGDTFSGNTLGDTNQAAPSGAHINWTTSP